MDPEAFASIATVAAALAGSGALLSTVYEYLRRKTRPQEETTEERIGLLTASLKEAVKLIGEIENEIKVRHTLAEKLQSDIETYDRLVKLEQPEVEAVAQLLRDELQVERGRSFWQNVAINSVFFILGAIVSAVFTRGI